MPFAGYDNFADCVSRNRDKNNPDAYCGSIKHKVEDKSMNEVLDQGGMASTLRRKLAKAATFAFDLATAIFNAGPPPRGKRKPGDSEYERPYGPGVGRRGKEPSTPADEGNLAGKREAAGRLTGDEGKGRAGQNQSRARTYLKPGESPPHGVAIRQGERGGRYYEGGPAGKPGPAYQPRGAKPQRSEREPYEMPAGQGVPDFEGTEADEPPRGVPDYDPDRGPSYNVPGKGAAERTPYWGPDDEGSEADEPSRQETWPFEEDQEGSEADEPPRSEQGGSNLQHVVDQVTDHFGPEGLYRMRVRDIATEIQRRDPGIPNERAAMAAKKIHRSALEELRYAGMRGMGQPSGSPEQHKMRKAISTGSVAALSLEADIVLKGGGRTYLKPGEKAPAGQHEQQGARGGRYYEGPRGTSPETQADENWARGKRPGAGSAGFGRPMDGGEEPTKPPTRAGSPETQADEDWARGKRPEGFGKPKGDVKPKPQQSFSARLKDQAKAVYAQLKGGDYHHWRGQEDELAQDIVDGMFPDEEPGDTLDDQQWDAAAHIAYRMAQKLIRGDTPKRQPRKPKSHAARRGDALPPSSGPLRPGDRIYPRDYP